ncbi:MAG: FtsQ-type POTRA domain-containing protein [Ectothiorhodospiraceae bacterium]|nr:FtsQ-type POTRA domain-containing protein [Chromatiales bacterium]MCP5153929.1 FtsQ-type POTRA domain-containing protein [Ectothiorhodospiraceae bacterium]
MSAVLTREPTVEPLPHRPRLGRMVAAALALVVALALAIPMVGDLIGRPVQAVRVAGGFSHVTRDELERAIAHSLGVGFFRIDLMAVREAAMSLPWVRDVTVRRVWPGAVHVAVVERAPVARWNDDALIEDDAAVFRPRSLDGVDGLPQLHGPEDRAAAVLARHRALDRALAPAGLGAVVELRVSARGTEWARLANGTTVVLDNALDEAAVSRYAQIFPRVLGERAALAERIDLRHSNGFAVRWREAVTTPGDGSTS